MVRSHTSWSGWAQTRRRRRRFTLVSDVVSGTKVCAAEACDARSVRERITSGRHEETRSEDPGAPPHVRLFARERALWAEHSVRSDEAVVEEERRLQARGGAAVEKDRDAVTGQQSAILIRRQGDQANIRQIIGRHDQRRRFDLRHLSRGVVCWDCDESGRCQCRSLGGVLWHTIKEELSSVVDSEVALDKPVAPPVLNGSVGVQRRHDRLYTCTGVSGSEKNKTKQT